MNTTGHSDHVELSLLGVDGSREPSITNYPSKFSERGRSIWKELLESPQYKRALSSFKSRDDQWTWCIRSYLKLCPRSGVFPFATATQQSNNDTVVRFLTLARRRAINYLDRIGMFRKVQIVSVDRVYQVSGSSFGVTATANLAAILDPTFPRWLQSAPPGPLFRTSGDSRMFVHDLFNNIDSRVSFTFDLQYNYHPKLVMTVNCQTPLAFLNARRPPTESEMKAYAENTIWLPIVRAHRFKGVWNRLF